MSNLLVFFSWPKKLKKAVEKVQVERMVGSVNVDSDIRLRLAESKSEKRS